LYTVCKYLQEGAKGNDLVVGEVEQDLSWTVEIRTTPKPKTSVNQTLRSAADTNPWHGTLYENWVEYCKRRDIHNAIANKN
jgi:hypothetical protein